MSRNAAAAADALRAAASVAARFAPRFAPRLAATLGAVVGLSAAASACPYCALSQNVDTLVYVGLLMLVPYVLVSGVVLWMRRVLARERE